MRSGELRKKLTLLGIDNVQVLDAYCPDWNTAAILVHDKYKDVITDKFSTAKIILSTYDHLDPVHIRDPKHKNLSAEDKLALSKQIWNNNMMRALENMRYSARYSVARSFFRNELISLEQLQAILKNDRSKNNNNNDINNNNNNGFVTLDTQEEQVEQMDSTPPTIEDSPMLDCSIEDLPSSPPSEL
jgi:hypothetical protein